MASRDHKRESFHRKLELLRTITHSDARTKTSIVSDASNYIRQMKQKVEKLSKEVAAVETPSVPLNSWPTVTVENLEKGFMVIVNSGRRCPGLLVSILETFEELGLNVLEARVSCADCFYLQAFGGENDDDEETVDAQIVEQAITNAIKNWSESI